MKFLVITSAVLAVDTFAWSLSLPKFQTGKFTLNKDLFTKVGLARFYKIKNSKNNGVPTQKPVFTRRPLFQWKPKTGNGMRVQIPYADPIIETREQDPAKCPEPDIQGNSRITRRIQDLVPKTDQQILSDAVWDANADSFTKGVARNYYSCGQAAGVCAVVWDFEKCTWMYKQVGTTTTRAPTTTTTRAPTTRRTTTTTTPAVIPHPEGRNFVLPPAAPGVKRTVKNMGQSKKIVSQKPMPIYRPKPMNRPMPEPIANKPKYIQTPQTNYRPQPMRQPMPEPMATKPKFLPVPELN